MLDNRSGGLSGGVVQDVTRLGETAAVQSALLAEHIARAHHQCHCQRVAIPLSRIHLTMLRGAVPGGRAGLTCGRFTGSESAIARSEIRAAVGGQLLVE